MDQFSDTRCDAGKAGLQAMERRNERWSLNVAFHRPAYCLNRFSRLQRTYLEPGFYRD